MDFMIWGHGIDVLGKGEVVNGEKIKQRAPRNRTIALSNSDKDKYKKRLIKIGSGSSMEDLLNKTAHQDIFEVLEFLPEKFVDLVFVPFLGSGTTSVVAKKLGRQYIGIEMDELYACLAEKRLEMAETDKVIQGYTDAVFWERNTLSEQTNKNRLSI